MAFYVKHRTYQQEMSGSEAPEEARSEIRAFSLPYTRSIYPQQYRQLTNNRHQAPNFRLTQASKARRVIGYV
jgi:hypothetical protein